MPVVLSRLLSLTWSFLTKTCKWINHWPALAASALPSALAPLQPAMLSVITCLLTSAKAGSGQWQTVLLGFVGGESWLDGESELMDTALLLLDVMCQLPSSEMFAAVDSLPPRFIATLCCLACEVAPQLEGTTAARADPDTGLFTGKHHTHFISRLCYVLGEFVVLPTATQRLRPGRVFILSADMACPAAQEVFKLGLRVCLASPTATFEMIMEAQTKLSQVLHCSQETNLPARSACMSKPLLHGNNASDNSGSSSLIPRQLTSDWELLALLHRCDNRHPLSLMFSVPVVLRMVTQWRTADGNTRDLQPHEAASLAGVLHYCSRHMCCAIEEQRHALRLSRPPLEHKDLADRASADRTQVCTLMYMAMGMSFSDLGAGDGE